MVSTKPTRIQRRRTKGWRMPPNTIYVGRPTVWGNPFRPDWDIVVRARNAGISAEEFVTERFRTALCGPVTPIQAAAFMSVWNLRFTPESVVVLRGKNLACWCPLDQSCHADVLLEVANA